MVRKYKRIAVAPIFARIMKARAAEQGKPLIDYTEDLANDHLGIIERAQGEIRPKKQIGHRRFLDEFEF